VESTVCARQKKYTSAILVLDELLLPTDLHWHINLFLLAASIFAYGQTSSGKTYTMTGITEYSVMDIYDYIEKVCVSAANFGLVHL
jgi:hypothetical protein